MYKTIHGLTIMYMADNIVMVGKTHDLDTRLFYSNDVNIPPHNTDVPKGLLSTTAVSSGIISLMKLGRLPICPILSGGPSFLSEVICLKTDDVHLYTS